MVYQQTFPVTGPQSAPYYIDRRKRKPMYDRVDSIIALLPQRLRKAMLELPANTLQSIREIRLRSHRFAMLDCANQTVPVFSFEKLYGAEPSLGPEMKSTGEVLGIANTFPEALLKAFIVAGYYLPRSKRIVMTVNDNDKQETVSIAERFIKLGYEINATQGTYEYLTKKGIPALKINKIEEQSPTILDFILSGECDLVVNTPTHSGSHNRDGFIIRRNAVETGTPCITSLDTANALLTALEHSDRHDLSIIDIATI